MRKYPDGFGKETEPPYWGLPCLVHSLIKGERKGALYGSIFTVLLALIFTCLLIPFSLEGKIGVFRVYFFCFKYYSIYCLYIIFKLLYHF